MNTVRSWLQSQGFLIVDVYDDVTGVGSPVGAVLISLLSQ
jgi:hypothetical protein